MTEEEIARILQAVPGARRAANGVLLQTEDGNSLHILSVRPTAELKELQPHEYFFADFCSISEILRLRSLRNAYDYLLRLRAEAIADSPRAVRVMMKRRELYEATKRPWALTHYYHSLDGFHKSYIDYLPRTQAKKLKAIPSGLVPITEANAACVASLAGEVVVVSESLYHFFYFMNIAVFGENLEVAMADRVNSLLIAYRIMNESEALDFDLDPRGLLPPKVEAKVRELAFDQMQFTFGHEYAHYLCGHISCGDVPMPGDRTEARTFAHDLEFEADAQAVRLVQQSAGAMRRVAHGALFVLIFLDTLYCLKQQHTLRPLPVSETHPSPVDRLWALQKTLGARSPMTDGDIRHALDVCGQLIEAFPWLLKSADRPDVLTFYGSIYLPSYMGKPKLDRIDF